MKLDRHATLGSCRTEFTTSGAWGLTAHPRPPPCNSPPARNRGIGRFLPLDLARNDLANSPVLPTPITPSPLDPIRRHLSGGGGGRGAEEASGQGAGRSCVPPCTTRRRMGCGRPDSRRGWNLDAFLPPASLPAQACVSGGIRVGSPHAAARPFTTRRRCRVVAQCLAGPRAS